MKAIANLALGLVVVVAVALVIMHLPFGDQKGAAKATVCLSNVKQRSLALLVYASDDDDRFLVRDHWMDATTSHLKSRDLHGEQASDPERWIRCVYRAPGEGGYGIVTVLGGEETVALLFRLESRIAVAELLPGGYP